MAHDPKHPHASDTDELDDDALEQVSGGTMSMPVVEADTTLESSVRIGSRHDTAKNSIGNIR
jgi:hypothetical protein